jgi:hypothetical protein
VSARSVEGMKYLLAAVLFFAQVQPTVKPLNSTPVATGCDNKTIQCTYTDVNVPPGPHFYFIVAQNMFNGVATPSGPSSRVDVVVPSDGKPHTVVLTWDAQSVTPVPSYYIYRGAPPTGLTGTPK